MRREPVHSLREKGRIRSKKNVPFPYTLFPCSTLGVTSPRFDKRMIVLIEGEEKQQNAKQKNR